MATHRLLAVLPARRTSTRTPGKNWAPLGPWASAWHATLVAAVRSECFEWVELSTDHPDPPLPPPDLVPPTAYTTHLRDPELNGDDVSAIAVVADSLARHPQATAVAMLLPNSPFRTAAHVQQAVAAWQQVPSVPLVCVQDLGDLGRRLRVVSPTRGRLYSPMPHGAAAGVVASTGALQLARRDVFLQPPVGFHWPAPRPHLLSYREGLDIDNPWDWHLAQLYAGQPGGA